MDTFMPIICHFRGHKPYPAIHWANEINDSYSENYGYACSRCGQYIRNYKYQLPGLTYKDTLFIEYIKKEYSKNLTYNVIEGTGDIIKISFNKEHNKDKSITDELDFNGIPFLTNRILSDFQGYLNHRLIGIQFDKRTEHLLYVSLTFLPSDYRGDYEMMTTYNTPEHNQNRWFDIEEVKPEIDSYIEAKQFACDEYATIVQYNPHLLSIGVFTINLNQIRWWRPHNPE